MSDGSATLQPADDAHDDEPQRFSKGGVPSLWEMIDGVMGQEPKSASAMQRDAGSSLSNRARVPLSSLRKFMYVTA
jgi:hypothetical protein